VIQNRLWKELPIEQDGEGSPEIHHTSIYRAFRREASGCIDAALSARYPQLQRDDLLDPSIIHSGGTTTAAKKGGDNIGFSGHKKMKDDKVAAFCDRQCNVIAPFVSAPENHNESLMARESLVRNSVAGWGGFMIPARLILVGYFCFGVSMV